MVDSANRNQVVERVALNAIIADTATTALTSYPLAEREKVYRKSIRAIRPYFPKSKKLDTVPQSTISRSMVATIRILSKHYEKENTAWGVVKDDLAKYVAPFVAEDEDALLGVAVGLGAFAVSREFEFELWNDVTVMAFGAVVGTQGYTNDFEGFLLLSFLIWTLCDEGYFRASFLERAIAHYVCTQSLKTSIEYLARHSLNRAFVVQNHVEVHLLKDLNRFEQLVFEACFYVLQSVSMWGKRPKAVLNTFIKLRSVDLPAISFAFTALVSASEHRVPLFLQAINKKTPYFDHVERIFAHD